ncbi:hypothetical protein HII31_08326 [Pseudocercospora fuligena]|uniref:Uncharacterized protein n=1 Tax=Pseudocercospora fuligena TaxID=685502 RepID=A0A8H6VKF5_9PEZI|nr:hypothetical protein HII31_08326 [Pseudocercospora fuligena]
MAYYYQAPAYQSYAPPPPPSYGPNGPQAPPQQYPPSGYYAGPPQQAYAAPPPQYAAPPPQYAASPPHYAAPPPASTDSQVGSLPQAFQNLNLAPPVYANGPPSPQPHSPQPVMQSPYRPSSAVYDPSIPQSLPVPPQQPPRPVTPGSGKLTYILRHVSEEKASWKNHHQMTINWAVVQPVGAISHAPYKFVFVDKTKSSEKHVKLQLFRVERGQDREVGSCTWHASDPTKMCLSYPFMHWPEPFDPVNDTWLSDTETLKDSLMWWDFDWKDPKVHHSKADKMIIRCATTGEDGEGKVVREKDLEACRIYLHDDEVDDVCAEVELPDSLFAVSRPEQIEETLLMAVAVGCAKMMGSTSLDQAAAATTAASSHSSNGKTAIASMKLLTESLNLANAIMGGGGGS